MKIKQTIKLIGKMMKSLIIMVAMAMMFGCSQKNIDTKNKLVPIVITEQTKHDTDDPAIWVHPTDPS